MAPWLNSTLAFAFFCLASSLVYLFNDLCDEEQDRQHPAKAKRPLAARRVTRRQIWWTLAGGLLLLASGVSMLLPQLLPLFGLYLVLNLGYSLGLKKIPALDLCLVAAGFVIRVLAGTQATEVIASDWILLCTGALALFLAAAKRRMEPAGSAAGGSARSPRFLDQTLSLSLVAALLLYSLYCSELNAMREGPSLILSVPFVAYALLHYMHRVYHNLGSSRGLLLDLPLGISTALWILSSWWLLK